MNRLSPIQIHPSLSVASTSLLKNQQQHVRTVEKPTRSTVKGGDRGPTRFVVERHGAEESKDASGEAVLIGRRRQRRRGEVAGGGPEEKGQRGSKDARPWWARS